MPGICEDLVFILYSAVYRENPVIMDEKKGIGGYYKAVLGDTSVFRHSHRKVYISHTIGRISMSQDIPAEIWCWSKY